MWKLWQGSDGNSGGTRGESGNGHGALVKDAVYSTKHPETACWRAKSKMKEVYDGASKSGLLRRYWTGRHERDGQLGSLEACGDNACDASIDPRGE